MSRKLTAVSLFSGCGGFDLGAQKAGVDIIWANDIDPHAVTAYRSLLPDVPFHEGDIRDFRVFPRADILIGCYPCTGFSQAAKRRTKTLEDRNLLANNDNYLFEEFLRVLKHTNPKFLFVENVQGMLSAANGWFFEQQLAGFEVAGYVVNYNLMNANQFGLAQDRKRVFIAGVRKDLYHAGFRYSFPEPKYGPQLKKYVILKDVIKGMEEWPEDEFCTKAFHGHYLTRNRKRGWNERSYTIVAHAHHVTLHPMGEPMKKVDKDKWTLQGSQNRRLSWRECAAIQGLPHQIQPSGNLRAKYRVVGNAVPPPIAESLIENLHHKSI
jgi:DNA (cytosine-5)-methyltransferase 1